MMRRVAMAMAMALLTGANAAGPVSAVHAQGLQGLQSGDQPLEINAEDGIEWRRDEQLYVARGNAVATRGDITVYADVMSAHYTSGAEGKSEIDRIEVHGNVRIVSPTDTVYGDRGAYDVINGVLVLAGKDLRMIGERGRITARDSLEYWEQKKLAVARGDAVAVREDKTIEADILTAHFEPDENDTLQMKRIEAYGNVRVATPGEFARGERGTYFVDREFATLIGEVKITRAENQLNGEYAEVDMKTGVSRLMPAPPGEKAGARVHGLIAPQQPPKPGNGS